MQYIFINLLAKNSFESFYKMRPIFYDSLKKLSFFPTAKV